MVFDLLLIPFLSLSSLPLGENENGLERRLENEKRFY